jgi:hypothetical protein
MILETCRTSPKLTFNKHSDDHPYFVLSLALAPLLRLQRPDKLLRIVEPITNFIRLIYSRSCLIIYTHTLDVHRAPHYVDAIDSAGD